MFSTFTTDYRFHPVGQGLFSSGSVGCVAQGKEGHFHWVFDCGSKSNKAYLSAQIDSYKNNVLGLKPEKTTRLDLLCISHFHEDHVNGLSQLLQGLTIGTLVIPHYTKLHRLLLAAIRPDDGPLDDDYLSFLENPVDFVIEGSEGVERVIFIVESGPESGPQSGTLPDPRPTKGNLSWSLAIHGQTPQEGVADEIKAQYPSPIAQDVFDGHARIEIKLIDSKAIARWEFMFFHMPVARGIGPQSEFHQALEEIEKRIPERGGIKAMLGDEGFQKQLRESYGKAFPGNMLNTAGLLQYTGSVPVLDSKHPLAAGLRNCLKAGRMETPTITHPSQHPNLSELIGESLSYDLLAFKQFAGNRLTLKDGLLCTGDTNLESEDNRKSLGVFLETPRVANIGVIQIPHHGSRHNWPLPPKGHGFNHAYSLFCYGTGNQYGHPHTEVLDSLADLNPIHVTEEAGWECSLQIAFPNENLIRPFLHSPIS